MSCLRPGAVSPEELVAFADGTAPSRVADHVRSCPHCLAEARRYAVAQGRLGRALARFDCPSPQELGEYHLDMVGPEERTRIARHLLDCRRCADEVATLRSFLAAEPELAPSIADRLRRVVATLVPMPLAGAHAGLRGTAEPGAATYQSGGTSISLSQSREGRRGALLFGLVLPESGDTAAVAGVPVRLVAEGQPDRLVEVDSVGSFAFEDVPAGQFALELGLPDEVIVIEDLTIR